MTLASLANEYGHGDDCFGQPGRIDDRSVLEPGDKIHIAERRTFEGDMRRHFVGEVTKSNDFAALANGYAFIYDADTNQYVRSSDRRLRVVPLIDSRVLIRVLPRNTEIEAIHYEYGGRLVVTDGKGFRLDINEFDVRR